MGRHVKSAWAYHVVRRTTLLHRTRDLVFACNITSCTAVSDAKEVGEEKHRQQLYLILHNSFSLGLVQFDAQASIELMTAIIQSDMNI